MDLAIHNAIYLLLIADSTLRTLLAENAYESPTIAAVYDAQAPQPDAAEDDTKFPHIVMGDETATGFDTDDVHGKDMTVTLHVWDRYSGRKRVRQITDAIYNLLHDASITVSGAKVVYCFWEFS